MPTGRECPPVLVRAFVQTSRAADVSALIIQQDNGVDRRRWGAHQRVYTRFDHSVLKKLKLANLRYKRARILVNIEERGLQIARRRPFAGSKPHRRWRE